jgi:xanthine dehydrogenase YagS FAD-binding subunit
MNRFEWVNAASVAEVVARGQGAIVKAGGVDVMDLLKERLIAPQRLVNLRSVPGLDRLGENPNGLSIGPLVTLGRLASEPIVMRRYRALAEACGHAATPQIRNMATVGGNLLQRPRCWYFRSEQFACRKKGGAECFAQSGENAFHAIFDNGQCAAVHPSSAACALVALGAQIEITGPSGARVIPLDGFFTKPAQGVEHENALGASDVVTEIRVPAPSATASSAYVKLSEKDSFDWPLVEVAVAIEVSGGVCKKATIALGAVAHTPMRAVAAEAAIVGKSIDEATARASGDAATQGATPLRDNGHKVQLLAVAVKRALLAATGGAREGVEPKGGAR